MSKWGFSSLHNGKPLLDFGGFARQEVDEKFKSAKVLACKTKRVGGSLIASYSLLIVG